MLLILLQEAETELIPIGVSRLSRVLLFPRIPFAQLLVEILCPQVLLSARKC